MCCSVGLFIVWTIRCAYEVICHLCLKTLQIAIPQLTLLSIRNKFYQVGHCPIAFPPEYYLLLRRWKTHSDCRKWKRGSMILKIKLVDSKIMNMLAKFFVKIKQVRFFRNIVIYKKILLIYPEEETLLIVNKCTWFTSQ